MIKYFSILKISSKRACYVTQNFASIKLPWAEQSGRFFFSNTPVETTEKSKTENENPRWMKFFHSQELPKVDIDRSIKSQSGRLLVNYVRNNYQIFTFRELVEVLIAIRDTSVTSLVLNEIKIRANSDNLEVDHKTIYRLFNFIKEFRFGDPALKKFVIVHLHTFFLKYQHFEQINIIESFLAEDFIDLEFLDVIKQFYQQDLSVIAEYYESLSLMDLIRHLKAYDQLKKSLHHKAFQEILHHNTINCLFEKLMKKLKASSILTFQDWEMILNLSSLAILRYDQMQEFKTILATLYYERFNIEENLGDKGHKYNHRPFFSSLMTPADRYLLYKPLIMRVLFANAKAKFFQDDKDINLIFHLHQFKIVDGNFLEALTRELESTYDQRLKKGQQASHQLRKFCIRNWKLLKELNYSKVIRGTQASNGPSTEKLDEDVIKFIYRQLNEEFQTIGVKKLLQLKLELKSSKRPQQNIGEPIDETTKLPDSDQKVVLEEKAPVEEEEGPPVEIQADTILEELGDKKEDRPVDSQPKEEKESQSIGRVHQELLEKYQIKLDAIPVCRTKFYDRKLSSFEISLLEKYITNIDLIAKLLIHGDIHPKVLQDIDGYFKESHNIHTDLVRDLCGYPGYLDNLLTIDILTRTMPYRNKTVFPASILEKLEFYKWKVDQFFNDPKPLSEKLIAIEDFIELRVSEGELLYEETNLTEEFSNFGKVPNNAYTSPDKEVYRAFIETNFDENVKKTIRFYVAPNIFDRYAIGLDIEEDESKTNFYLMLLHTHCFKMIAANSRMKILLGSILDANKIPYVRNYVNFPAVVDYLIYPNTPNQLAVQVRDMSKILLGSLDVKTYEAELNDLILNRLGYKIVELTADDFSSEDKSVIEKLRQHVPKK